MPPSCGRAVAPHERSFRAHQLLRTLTQFTGIRLYRRDDAPKLFWHRQLGKPFGGNLGEMTDCKQVRSKSTQSSFSQEYANSAR